MTKVEKALNRVVKTFHDMDDFKQEALTKVKNNLKNKYGIPEGVVESLLVRNAQDLFEKEDIRLIGVFIKETLEVTDNTELLHETYTEAELKELEQYLYSYKKDSVQLPLEIYPALKLNSITHSIRMSAKMVAQLLENQIANYNHDIQREAVTVRRKGQIIKSPKINHKNVEEMTELLLKGQLMDSTLYFNAAPRTSDSGDELLMDEKNHKLVITEGTRLDILDGFHRCLASQKAYQINPDINFKFNVVISNYTTKEAQRWQAQHAKAMAWSPGRIRELQQESRADKVVAAMRANPDVGDYISSSRKVTDKHLVSFSQLSDAIDSNFTIKNRRDEVEVAELVSKYLDDLAQYEELDWKEKRSESLILGSVGTSIIVSYAALHRDSEYSTIDFYDFLDKLQNQQETWKKELQIENLNVAKISDKKMKQIKEKVKEVI